MMYKVSANIELNKKSLNIFCLDKEVDHKFHNSNLSTCTMYQGIGLIMQTALQIGSFHKHIYCSSSHLHLSAWSVSVPCLCTWNLNLIFIYMYDVLYYSWHNILCGVQQYRRSSGYWWQRGTSSNIPAGQSSKFKVKMCLLQNCSRFKKSDGPKVLTIKIWKTSFH